MPEVEWDKLFVFNISPLELFIRGTIIYLFILVLMRVLRREPGTVGIADLLMIVLIADASQNAMAGTTALFLMVWFSSCRSCSGTTV